MTTRAHNLIEAVVAGANPRAVLESSLNTADQLVAALEAAIRRSFPHSALTIRFKPSTIAGPLVDGAFTVGAKGEWAHGIEHNDLSRTTFSIYGVDKDGNLSGRLEFNPSTGGSFIVNPAPGSGMAYDSVRVGLSKKSGTPEQIVQHVDRYFAKLLSTLKANRERLPADHVDLLKSIHLGN